MHTANQSVLAAFHQTVNKIAGGTQLQVLAGDTGFEESVLERVQAVPEVDVAVPVIEASANTELPGQGSLLILGVDMTGDRTLRDYSMESANEEMIDDPLVFLAQPDSIIVTDTFAKRNSLAIDSKLPMHLWTERSGSQFNIMKSGRLASCFRRQPGSDGHLRRAESVPDAAGAKPYRSIGKRRLDGGGSAAKAGGAAGPGISGGVALGKGRTV